MPKIKEKLRGLLSTNYTAMNHKTYYSIDGLLKAEANINYCTGGRNSGKSFEIASYLVSRAIENNDKEKFIYLRHLESEVTKEFIDSYFSDLHFDNPRYPNLANYNYIYCTSRGRKIMIGYLDPETGDISKEMQIGLGIPLKRYVQYKSTKYPEYNYILFEEFSRVDIAMKNEMEAFHSIMSTIVRANNTFKVFCIGNLVDRNSCHYQHYQMTKALTQKEGTIDIYKSYSDPPVYDELGNHLHTRIALEKVDNRSEVNILLMGATVQASTSGNSYETQEHPLIIPNDDEIIHTVIFAQGFLKFKAVCKINKKGWVFWEVTHKTSEIQKGTRVISDECSFNPLWSTDLKGLTQAENKAFNLLKEGKVRFGTNLCGTEFMTMLNRL